MGLVAGCGDDTEAAPPICNWIFDREAECAESLGGTGDESGDGDGDDGDGGGFSDACVVANGDRPRTVVQCNGSFGASIEFATLLGDCGNTLGDPGWCDEQHDFGLGFEPYEMPAVMACCDADGAPEDEVLRMCSVDLIEQICMSVPRRLQMLVDEGVISIGKGQAKALGDWLLSHPQDCYDAFNNQSDTPGALERASWLVNGGENKGWSMLENFTITLEEAIVTTTTLPESKDQFITCFDNNFNNSEVFEEIVPVSPGINNISRLADAGSVAIAGPIFNAGRVVGFGDLMSQTRGCEDPWCSTLEITQGLTGEWTLEELSLFADGTVAVRVGGLSVPIERAAVRLYGVSRAVPDSGPFVIDSGEAHFVVSGIGGGAPETRWASNTTPIIIHKAGDGWVADGFTITHVDSSGLIWTITIPKTTWN